MPIVKADRLTRISAALLRAAGTVTLTESGTVIYYSLRRQRLDDASIEVKQFLVGNDDHATP